MRRIAIDGRFGDWASEKVEYRDTAGDTFHRDYKGYGGLRYTNDSGRNDIVTCKVALDRDTVAFYAQTSAPLTPSSDPNWMLLLIDSDRNAKTGWHGYDYLVNRRVVDSRTTTLMRYSPEAGGGKWVAVARLAYGAAGNALEVAVPRKLLGLKGDALSFDFHWADNPADLNDAISLCVNGDSAPNRRFNYRCIWRKSPSARAARGAEGPA